MKESILIISIIGINIFYYMILGYNRNYIEYQNRKEILEYIIGIDGINIVIIGLVVSIVPIILIIENNKKREWTKIIILILIISILLLVQDLLPFYILYEIGVIPLYYMLTKEGSKYKKYLYRSEAGIRLIIMTLLGGILLLIGVILIQNRYGTTNNEILTFLNKNIINIKGEEYKKWIYILFLISFFIKIPIFPFHTWLPLAHSESPTYGSIILAGLILKLATYGIIRYNIGILGSENWEIINRIGVVLIIISIIYYSILPLRGLFDLKKIIAYSSIVHMSICTIGLLNEDLNGIIGSTILILTHGWISSGLFYLIGILYKRYHTRYITYYQGISQVFPLWSLLFILFIFCNVSLPITYGFIGELFILKSLIEKNIIIIISILVGLFFSSLFSIYFMSKILFGPISRMILLKGYKDITIKEAIIILPLCFILYFLTFYPNFLPSIFLLSLSLFFSI